MPGKEDSIRFLWGVSGDSVAIRRGEMQEDNLYQKPCVWLNSSSPEISIYLWWSIILLHLKIGGRRSLHLLGEQQLEFRWLLKMLKEGGEKPTC